MNPRWLVVIGVLLLVGYVLVTQTTEHFAAAMTSQGPVLTLVHASWCGHCKVFKPAWDSMGPTVTIGAHTVALQAIDGEKDADRMGPYKSQVTGYPTVFYQATPNAPPQKYSGPRSVEGLRSFLAQQLGA